MAAANELIQDQGFPQLRIEEVAERAQLSVGTFYLYFEGKTDLFANLLIEHTEELRNRLQEAYKFEGTATQRLSRGLGAYLDFVAEYDKGFLYFRDSGTVHTTVGRLSTWAFQTLSDEVRPVLDEAIEEGSMRREDPELVAQAILGQIQHMAGYWLEHREQYTKDEMKRFLAGLMAFGLRSGA